MKLYIFATPTAALCLISFYGYRKSGEKINSILYWLTEEHFINLAETLLQDFLHLDTCVVSKLQHGNKSSWSQTVCFKGSLQFRKPCQNLTWTDL